MPNPETIYENANLRLTLLPGGNKRLIVSFTGVGREMGGIQTDEFIGTASAKGKNTVLFVTDKKCTWFNSSDVFANTLQTIFKIQDRMQPRQTVTLGNSMGGFGAMLFARLIGAQKSIAFSPQATIDPNLIHETRWKMFRKNIKDIHWPLVPFGARTDYFVFSGVLDGDSDHLDLLPQQKNLRIYRLPFKHDAALELKRRGLQKPLLTACLSFPAPISDTIIKTRLSSLDKVTTSA